MVGRHCGCEDGGGSCVGANMNDMKNAVLCDMGVFGGYRRGVVVRQSLELVELVSFDKIGELS